MCSASKLHKPMADTSSGWVFVALTSSTKMSRYSFEAYWAMRSVWASDGIFSGLNSHHTSGTAAIQHGRPAFETAP